MGELYKGDVFITDQEIVESYIPIAKFIAGISGPRCEVVLHYLADMDHSIIAIENGSLTGRKVGDTMLDFDLHRVFEPECMRQPYLINYEGKSTIGERVFRLSTFYIRNPRGDIIGLLNTNVDISGLLTVQKLVAEELSVDGGSSLSASAPAPQAMYISTNSMIDHNFAEAMEKYGYTDPEAMNKEDKLRIITYLFERNIFALKGAVGIVARKLCVSEPTAYRYLRSLREHIPLDEETDPPPAAGAPAI